MIGLCEKFRSLPRAGGVLDQPAWLLRMLRILDIADPDQKMKAPELELADLQLLL